MGLIGRLFGDAKPARRAADPAQGQPRSGDASALNSSHFQSSLADAAASASDSRQQFQLRRDLLRIVLRDVSGRTGIPSTWLGLQVLTATSSRKTNGVHARLVIKHWDERLAVNLPGLEHHFIQQLMVLDPLADHWFNGISWQLELPSDFDLSPLPRASSWAELEPEQPAVATATPIPATVRAESGADVIAGPVRIGDGGAGQDPRADLERMLADGDREARRRGNDFAKTQPSGLR